MTSAKLTETHRNLSEVLALTHQFAKDDCALAKAAGTNLDLILGGQGKWGIWKATAMLHYPCASCASCACDVFFFLSKSGIHDLPKMSSFG